MTLEEAIALQPVWLAWWLNWLFLVTVVLPLSLLIWRGTRWTAVLTVAASVLGGLGVVWLYGRYGYVKLLGLPHILVWTPLAVYLAIKMQSGEVGHWPRRILALILATILISLAFDYTDVARYVLGERAPLVPRDAIAE